MTTANLPKHVVAKFDIFISLSLQRSGHDIAKDFCLCLSKTCDLEIDIDRLPHNDLVCSMKIQKCLDVILQKSCTPQQSRLHLWQPNSTNDTSITAKEIKQTTKITKSAMPPPPKQQKVQHATEVLQPQGRDDFQRPVRELERPAKATNKSVEIS